MSHKLSFPYGRKHGQSPGTPFHVGVTHDEEAVITLTRVSPDQLIRHRLASLSEVPVTSPSEEISWLNISGLHSLSLIQETGERFSILPLTLEDIMNTLQRPKVEFFDDYIYCVLKLVRPDRSSGGLEIHQISLVLQPGRVISFQEKADDIFAPLIQRLENVRGRLRSQGADYLFYAILDLIADHYFVCLEFLGEAIEKLEDRALNNPDPSLVPELQQMKRELLFLRKALWPLREAVNVLLRDGHTLLCQDTEAYFRDLYDHIIQSIDTLELFRDMASGLLDVYLTNLNNRMSEVMKILAIISTIFIPMSFVAGIYGMNFHHMPELRQPWAYPAVLVVCALIAVGMVLFFRRKHWL